MRRALLVLSLSVTAGCVSGNTANVTGDSSATPPPANSTDLVDPGFGPWSAEVHADHPLVGAAWSVADGQPLTRAQLEARVAAARFVLLGETHDNPDHHRLQGELLTVLLERAEAAGRPAPAVAYEMLDPATQPAIDAYVAAVVAGGDADVDGFATLVSWADSGWPEWTIYRPAFAPALAAGVPIFAAQFPRAESRRYMAEGIAALPTELVDRYRLAEPLPAALLEPQLDEMFASHCEMVPRDQLAPMVEIQRVRDARMAAALERGVGERGQAVLIAGTGHTRATGVPQLLTSVGEPPAGIVSVGFVAVRPGVVDPREYGDEFDVIVLTPDVAREDPCAGM